MVHNEPPSETDAIDNEALIVVHTVSTPNNDVTKEAIDPEVDEFNDYQYWNQVAQTVDELEAENGDTITSETVKAEVRTMNFG